MSMSDPLGDMLTRIRNGQHARKTVVSSPSSRFRTNVLEVLKREGFIHGYEVTPDGVQGNLSIRLKYGPGGEAVINEIKRESKPGRRVYREVREITRVLNGTGISIYTTPDGLLSDRE